MSTGITMEYFQGNLMKTPDCFNFNEKYAKYSFTRVLL